MVLGDLGEGFPITFQLMKYINYLMLFLTLIFTIPAIGLVAKSVIDYGERVNGDEPLSMYSFGGLLKCTDPTDA
jgi:hypothetical protein